ncbi:unnamed protein product, partial [Amoebophrya sp. A25]
SRCRQPTRSFTTDVPLPCRYLLDFIILIHHDSIF